MDGVETLRDNIKKEIENISLFFKKESKFLFNLINVLRLAIPILLSRMGMTLMTFVDLIFVGHISADKISSAGLGNAISTCIMYIIIGLGLSLDTLMSQAYGAENYELIGILLQRSMIIHTVLYIPCALLLLLTEPFLLFIKQDPLIAHQTGQFVNIITIGYLPLIYTRILVQFLNSQSNVVPGMIANFIANFLNILLNYFFIYGIPGVWNGLGFIGSPLATTISRTIQFLLLLFFILVLKLHKKTWTGFRLLEAVKLNGIWEYLKYGVPASIMFNLEVWGFTLLALPAGYLGKDYLSAHTVLLNMAIVGFAIPISISSATSILVGQSLGAKDPQTAKEVSYISVVLIIFVMSFIGFLISFFRSYIGYVYVSEPNVISILSNSFLLFPFFEVFDGIQAICSGVLRGSAKLNFGALFNFLSYNIIGIPFGLVMAFVLNWKLIGLWGGLLIGLGSVSIMMLIYIFYFLDWEYESRMTAERVGKKK